MLTRRMFVVEQVQASLFLADASVFSSTKAIGTMLGTYPERFSGQLLSMPLSNDDPPEIPRVVLQSPGGGWRVQFSPVRMDAVRSLLPTEEAMDFGQAVDACRDMVSYYAQETGTAVNRLALVVTRRFPTENPAEWLISRYCNKASQREPLNNSATFELHNHKVYTPLGSTALNSWVRCKSATHPRVGPVVVVVQDLNTAATDEKEQLYGPEAVTGFFDLVRAEADSIFDKYFPITIIS